MNNGPEDDTIEATFEDLDIDTQRLITLTSTYRGMVQFLLDNFVSSRDGETEDWMKLMDEYAFGLVAEPKKVELKIVKE
jgi:hypothetical protein